MRPPIFSPSIIRLSGRPRPEPEEPGAFTAPRPRGSRRPHTDGKVAGVRRLIEETTLTYGEIAGRTGVGRASICRWTRDGAWKRPLFAPRATDTVPRPRAGQKLKLRLLAERLRVLAERHVRELEEAPGVDVEKLVHALEVLKMARLEAMGRRRRRRPPNELYWSAHTRAEATRAALRGLRRGGVDIDRAPAEALELYLDAHQPPEDHPALHPRRQRSKRKQHHAWMLGRE